MNPQTLPIPSPASLKIEYLPPDGLKPYSRNARKHSKRQIRQIADSIQEFGFTNPVLIDADKTIVAGHGRVAAARLIGLQVVPTIGLEHLTEDQKRAYIIADNRLAEKAGWDNDILKIEFQHLLTIDTGFDISITGFETPEIDLIIQDPDKDPDDECPDVNETAPAITKLGDVWQLGSHLLLCGDALQENSYAQLLGNDKANLIFTDPPYNVPIPGHVSGLGKAQHENFAMASGEMSSEQFVDFLKQFARLAAQYSMDGSIHFICMDWRHIRELLEAAKDVYSELKNICVWNKNNGGMGSLYRSKHEFVAVFKNGHAPHINNIELGKHGRYRTNVWNYAGQTSPHKKRNQELAMHPTVKPVGMVSDAILDCSNRNDIVLDPFGGSGTTLIAAERTGRRARLIELDPRYCDVIIQRWQKFTKKQALHAVTGQHFGHATTATETKMETENAG